MHLRKDAHQISGREIFLEDRMVVEVVTKLLEVIDRLVVELHSVVGAEAVRDREDGLGLTGDNNFLSRKQKRRGFC